MPSQSKTTIAGQLSAARIAINNTIADSELQALVALYGYGAERMQAGQQLYDAAAGAVNAQTAAAGIQQQATAQARAACSAARASYQALAQLARAVFARNPAHRAALGLVGTAPQSTTEFLAAATTLFENASNVEEIKGILATYGYDEARLARERATIAACDQANQAQVAAMGAAQQATRDQSAARAPRPSAAPPRRPRQHGRRAARRRPGFPHPLPPLPRRERGKKKLHRAPMPAPRLAETGLPSPAAV